jgi:hypothetical protein
MSGTWEDPESVALPPSTIITSEHEHIGMNLIRKVADLLKSGPYDIRNYSVSNDYVARETIELAFGKQILMLQITRPK